MLILIFDPWTVKECSPASGICRFGSHGSSFRGELGWHGEHLELHWSNHGQSYCIGGIVASQMSNLMYFCVHKWRKMYGSFGRGVKEVGRVEKPELLGMSQRSSPCEKFPACSHSSVVRVNLASLEFIQLRAFLLAKPSSTELESLNTGNSAARIHRWWQSYRKTYGHKWHFNFQYCLSTWSPPSIIERDEISKIYLIKLKKFCLKNVKGF